MFETSKEYKNIVPGEEIDKIVDPLAKIAGKDAAEDAMQEALRKTKELRQQLPGTNHVLILNMEQLKDTVIELDGPYFHEERKRNGPLGELHYGVWIFQSGRVDHTKCDGGWVNWAFSGTYDRSGYKDGEVSFHP